jgi:hypothetical protein
MTQEGDLVLVYMDDQPGFFARIESIDPDVKPEWFQVKMLVLQVPLLVITWILRSAYINGEGFTMGGRPMRLEKVVPPPDQEAPEGQEAPGEAENEAPAPPAPSERPKVVSLADRRKKDHSS